MLKNLHMSKKCCIFAKNIRYMQVFIKGNVPSLKNSKIKTARGVFPSKTVTRYLRYLGIKRYSARKKEVEHLKNKEIYEIEQYREFFASYKGTDPIKVGFHFVRGSRHKFDFHNAVQILADLFTAYDFIEDDNMDFFIPLPYQIDDKWYSYDKEYPGVYVKIFQ